jgi:hypothetical protein
VARVAVQLLARSIRHAGCMTRGPGPPCWARWKSERCARLARLHAACMAELARKEGLVGRSLAGSSISGTDAGIDLPRPRAGLMSSEDSWPRPRGDQPSRLLEPDSWRRPGRRWPGRDDEVVL